MITSRRAAAATVLVPALLIGAAPLASAASGPRVLKASQVGKGFVSGKVATTKVTGSVKGCRSTIVGKGDESTTVTFSKPTATDKYVVSEAVFTAKDAAAAAKQFKTAKATYTSCATALIKENAYTLKASAATAPKVPGAAASFGVKVTIAGTVATPTGRSTAKGAFRAAAYLKGRYLVVLLTTDLKETGTRAAITLDLVDDSTSQRITAAAAKAAVRDL